LCPSSVQRSDRSKWASPRRGRKAWARVPPGGGGGEGGKVGGGGGGGGGEGDGGGEGGTVRRSLRGQVMGSWGSVLTWPVEGVARPVVVVSLVEGQPDVRGAFRDLLEHQARHVTPQLEGGARRQPHGAQRQVARPVHHLEGQLAPVPLLHWERGRRGAQTPPTEQ